MIDVIKVVIWFSILSLLTIISFNRYEKAKKNKEDGFGYALFGVIVYVLLIGFVINAVIYGEKFGFIAPIITIPTGNLDVWVGFFGSLTGAAIGGLITLYVLNRTIKTQEKNTKDLIEQYDKQRELQLMPVLHVLGNRFYTRNDLTPSKDGGISIVIKVINIGNGAAKKIRLFVLDENFDVQSNSKSYRLFSDRERSSEKSVIFVREEAVLLLPYGELDKQQEQSYIIRFTYQNMLGHSYESKVIKIMFVKENGRIKSAVGVAKQQVSE